MHFELVDIQPREITFTFEPRKQSSCTIHLFNKTDKHVAFKVKTTNPKKYCVRPNTGVISSKSLCEFKITMQAQREPPPDMVCKDKFLVQSKVVPEETSDKDITSETFSKDDGEYVQENKLRVILVDPLDSPDLSPINGAQSHPPNFESSPPKCLEDLSGNEETQIPQRKPAEEEFKQENKEEPVKAKDVEIETAKDVEKVEFVDEINTMKSKLEPMKAKDVEIETAKDVENVEFVDEINTMKSKLNALELKLSEAEATISRLTQETRGSAQEKESLQRELARLRSRKGARKVQVGFPLLYVVMVALISLALGYMFHRQ
ncbi:PREDICTED: vesicle-associated protein 1-2-like [Ipomoea nil]|uniref:vesicle-associated protein 1-2-like n=1 Tax=Ipomoea nil TaxID=35883 RepID=UPI000901D28A|nr:PREDICTED: vesicle-associated protein 1-2-like [Ipomoea nil]XP_019194838.1 PREDICTED: vesicle-associated protein 1-2-like [Ipomoea nil]XP_019194839.1 PREDICTED: vesicle-associated protein 1-2-like [Ipomoea nil]XP_019194840.1 PREDICTED: vesicle-associated protein 1-2-like [Ipomoea nil]XP_019194842.1 PREDICTED: vesicle-associated protein 1-2-like [Ipomoea nil]XP_019194843.1 PREDICTED: vesicle-associated protein 1-2-like [Ipomoea nil]